MSRTALARALAITTGVAWHASELEWALRRRRHRNSVVSERRSAAVIVAATLAGDLAAATLVHLAPQGRLTGDRSTAILIALPGAWAGLVLRRRAVRTLGTHFSANVEIRSDHQLIRTGPYRHIRHPAYAGGLLVAASAGLALDHPAAGMAAVAGRFAGIAYRIRVEEAHLRSSLGCKYSDYAASTARLIPGIW